MNYVLMLHDILLILYFPAYVDLGDPLDRLIIHLLEHALVSCLYFDTIGDLVSQNCMLVSNIDLLLQPFFFVDQFAQPIFHHHFLNKAQFAGDNTYL